MPNPAATALQIQVAVPSPQVGRRIAAALLERRLCACVQTLGPVTSTYHWRGRIETAREWLLLIKTRAVHFAAVEAGIRELHPYDVPEIIALTITRGSKAYFDWLRAETAGSVPGRVRAAPHARRPRR